MKRDEKDDDGRPAIRAVAFLKRPDDPARLPVLTDELVPARTKSGRTLWLAWDETRVPLLDEVVELPARRGGRRA